MTSFENKPNRCEIENRERQGDATQDDLVDSTASNDTVYHDDGRRTGDFDNRDGEDQDLGVIFREGKDKKAEEIGPNIANGRASRVVGQEDFILSEETCSINEAVPKASRIRSDCMRSGKSEGTAEEDLMVEERTFGQIPGPTAADVMSSNDYEDSSFISPPHLNPGAAERQQKKDKLRRLSLTQLQALPSPPESVLSHQVGTKEREHPEVQSNLKPPEDHSPPETEEPPPYLSCLKEDEGAYDARMAIGSNGSPLREFNRSRARNRRPSNGKKHVHLQDPLEFQGRHANSDPSQPLPTTIGQRLTNSATRQLAADERATHKSDGTTSQLRRVKSSLKIDADNLRRSSGADRSVSPVPASIPIPPFSIPTYLQLELSSNRPSSLYIHRTGAQDYPYESSKVMLERLQNFFLLPPLLEQALSFGTLACLDSWLHTFTILPLQFLKAVLILSHSWAINLGLEIQFVASYVVYGLGRMWKRRRSQDSVNKVNTDSKPISPGDKISAIPSSNLYLDDVSPIIGTTPVPKVLLPRRASSTRHHRRSKSVPSTLSPNDKAVILKGLLMVFTCTILMYFDASRMYHWIRGQAAIKLYVIYNVLEVGDRLLSAIGQDILECLFSQEALERKPDGRSKVARPFWMFAFALIYTVIHATALFYQVMTLNVAVNSYSNALITLLLSNQFVEIKSTVFKKFERENLFQLTCADVVERFQLWLMLIIIASRNFVETGGFKLGNSFISQGAVSNTANGTTAFRPSTSILPQSFTLLIPSSVFLSLDGVNSILPEIGHLLAPFLVVLGSEMVVDWLKHAYISKFNNLRPAMYGRFLDILAKDYYTNAFSDQNLNRRLGLPVIPLACLFFRVSVQTYQMFLTAWLPQLSSSSLRPSTSSTTSLSEIRSHYTSTPGTSSEMFATFISPSSNLTFFLSLPGIAQTASSLLQKLVSLATPSPASFVPIFTLILVLLLYISLLLAKLVLGMILLGYSRTRYKNMKYRERESAAQRKRESRRHHQQQYPSSSIFPTHQESSSKMPLTSTDIPPSSTKSDLIEGGRRVGGWGAIEIGEDRRRWIYADDPEGLKRVRDREEKHRNGKSSSSGTGTHGLENVKRYEMVAKRIW